MGPPQAPPQESTVDRAPLLRRLPPHPGRPVDLRRPRQRRLPPPLRLDTDRPARTGPGRYSPDDPALAPDWADRRRKSRPPQLAPSWERLIRAQHGRCPACGLPLLHTDQPPDSPSQWEQWYRTVRRALTHQGPTPGSRPTTHRLVHTSCAGSTTSRRSRTTATTAELAPP